MFDDGEAATDNTAARRDGRATAAKRRKGRVNAGAPPTPSLNEAHKPDAAGGRPAHAPTAESRRQVEAIAQRFISRQSIAAIIGICENTLRRHYPDELDVGDAKGPWCMDRA